MILKATWGRHFDAMRERAYVSGEIRDINDYVCTRAMGFCEWCGTPRAETMQQVGNDTTPRSFLAVCNEHTEERSKLLTKAQWLESNLTERRLLYVTAAVIQDGSGNVMVCQKKNGLWEFPGGKMDEGEDLESCIIREIREELSVGLKIVRPFLLVDHDYGDIKLRLYSFIAKLGAGSTVELRDHLNFKFVHPAQLNKESLSQADVAIASRTLCDLKHREEEAKGYN